MSGVNHSADARTQMVDEVQKWRRLVASGQLPRERPVASDDLAYRDDDGEIIYTVVSRWQDRHTPSDFGTAYRTRSLADAIQKMRDYRMVAQDGHYGVPGDPEIRVGGMPVLTDAELYALEHGRLPNGRVPVAVLNSITADDSQRFKGKKPGLDSIFGARLDPIYRRPKDAPTYTVGDVPLNHAMSDILDAARRGGMDERQHRRLEDFAAFATLAGSAATQEEVEKAWKRVQQTAPTQEELDAAWAARKAEMLQEAREFVAKAKHAAGRIIPLARGVLSSVWHALREDFAPHPGSASPHPGSPGHGHGHGGPVDVTPYASAILDEANVKGAWRDFPGYMNAYERGQAVGDHLSFKESLPTDPADILTPVSDISQSYSDAPPMGWKTQYPLTGGAVLDAMNEVQKRGGRTLINANRVIDIARMADAAKAVSRLGSATATQAEARAAGRALFDLVQAVGEGSETVLLDRMKVSGERLSTLGFDAKTAILTGFEDAMHSAGTATGARVTSLMAELDRRMATPAPAATPSPQPNTTGPETAPQGQKPDQTAADQPPHGTAPNDNAKPSNPSSPAPISLSALEGLESLEEDHDPDGDEPLPLDEEEMGMSI
ncbi:hypothetical protein [Acetobacter malorum]|nr:hypothetical protein [Acetobacter malorum]